MADEKNMTVPADIASEKAPDSERTASDASVSETVSQEPPQDQEANETHAGVTDSKEYSVFSHNAKRCIIVVASLAAWFSPLASQTYLPALNQLARDLNVTSSQINLSVTTYLIMQGIAPTFVASFSESSGRRLAYVACFTIFIPANIGLALQDNYAALLVLRLVQSAGSSGTVALVNGVVADMVTSAQRGTYIAYAQLASILGPAIGPVLGGVISNYIGWRWIFWVLAILSGSFFVGLAFFMPETARNVVGDGSVPPPPLSRSVTSNVMMRRRAQAGLEPDPELMEKCKNAGKLKLPDPLATLKIIFDKECAILLFVNGFVMCCFSAVSTSLPELYGGIYGLNELEISLCFLPFAFGSVVSALCTGRLVNWNYRRWARKIGFPLVHTRRQDLTNFPIERARLELAAPLTVTGAALCLIYGWLLEAKVSLAGPLVILAALGVCILASNQLATVLLVDVNPDKPAVATASNNLVRCLLGAGASALISPMINGVGVGWALTIVAGAWVSFAPWFYVLIKYGPGWRLQRKMKREAREAQAEKT